MSRIVVLANAAMFVVFVSWAGFQYNDPDPLLWIVVYGVAALGCLLFHFGRLPRTAAWVYVAACVAAALYLGGRVVAGREFFFDEQGREMLGFLICAAWIGFLARKMRAPDRHPA